ISLSDHVSSSIGRPEMPSLSLQAEAPFRTGKRRSGGARVLRSAWGLAMLAPMLIARILFFVAPMAWLLYTALTDQSGSTLSAFVQLSHDPIFRRIASRTIQIAALVTAIAVLLAVPVAMLMASLQGKAASLVGLLVII